MPLSEFLRMSKRKHESDQQMSATHLTDPSSIPENDFVELVWDNGQLTMQGQSSRSQKSDNPNNIPSHMHKHRGKYFENPNSSRKVKIGSVESFQDEGLPAVPSIDTDSNQHNGLVPWLNNYHAEEFLSEASDVTVNEKANHNSLSSNKSSFNQTLGHLHKFFATDTQKSEQRMQKPDLARAGSGSSLPNFPFISRYTSLQKANLHHTADPAASCSLSEAMANKAKTPGNGITPVESAELMASNLQKERLSGSQPCEKPYLEKKSYELCQEEQEKNDVSLHQVVGPDSNKRVSNEVKAAEPVVAASSVCSGSSGDRASNDQPQLKRKCHDIDESEYRSEDVEEKSVGVRKAAPTRGGAGSKRSRAAEVHNLSERRRRDRINEKMRALQELIPNCNKTDKASMLDEAIEYLKTLQLQVQVMSMGTGLWMPPMMFPAGMQHMHATHMNNYSPMGIGVGFGMNMLDMNGGFPMFPAQQMQHPHFPSPPLSRPAKFPGLAGPNVPVLGHPGQGHPMPVPRAPVVPFSAHTSTNSSAGVGVATVGFQMEVPNASPTPNLENPAGDKNAQPMHNADVNLANGNIVKEKSR